MSKLLKCSKCKKPIRTTNNSGLCTCCYRSNYYYSKENKNKLIDEGRALMEMFQAGFYSGYNLERGRKKSLFKLRKRCITAFNLRFLKKIEKVAEIKIEDVQ